MSLKPAETERLNATEQGLLILAMALPLLWVAWARIVLLPGWASVDEAGQVAQLQLMREGWSMPWRLGGGGIQRQLLAGWLRLSGWNVYGLRSFGLLLYLAESAALAWVVQPLFGARATLWALCVNAFSAVTFTRMGSVLWFQLQPLEWWLAAGSLLRVRRWPGAALWGLGVGLLLLDYDGWVLALPGLALLAWVQLKDPRTRAAALLGAFLAIAFVLFLNRDWFQSTGATRVEQTLPSQGLQAFGYFFTHLRELIFGGGRALLYLGVPEHPQIAPWAWIGLLGLGSLAKRDWVWALAALPPLLSLALHAPGIEVNRCLAAWPAFCLLMGLGLSRLSQLRPWVLGALALWAFAGAGLELKAHARGLEAYGPLFYTESWDQLNAGKALRESGSSVTLLSDLGPRSGADFRFATGLAPAQLQQGPIVAVIPWQDQRQLDPALGQWQSFQSQAEQGPVLLLRPRAANAAALQAADRALAPLWPVYYTQPLDRLLAELQARTAAPIADPRLRTALWEGRFKLQRYLNQPMEDEGPRARQLDLLRVDALIRGARRLTYKEPALALALAEEATQRDPRRQEAWRLRLDLLQSQQRMKDWTILLNELQKDPQKGQFQGSWLQD